MQAMNNQSTPSVPKLAISLVLEHQEIATHLEKYPQHRSWAEDLVERNLLWPLAKCQQLSIEPCASFPRCLCGTEALENTMKELSNRGWLFTPRQPDPKPTPPDNGLEPPEPDRAPAMVMPRPKRPSITRAVAQKIKCS